ncbi:hypothetical protein C2845_PM16G21910 [Panicum miliaceum]|uniref:Uncharacterized protein n=1 Tax=Panicum miliaceum TaxID=4540 RepID=A0A3L6PTU5_PANMI|nr:hypothetical protein C2845_PM16G21910 [Panicum miliaceum]
MKWGYVDEILRLNCEKGLVHCLTALQELSRQARNCYPEDIKISSEEFIQMLLLDGCFILGALGGTQELFTQTMPMADDGTPHEIILEDAGSTGRECFEHGRTVGPSIEESSTSQQSKQADEGTELEQ